MALSVKELTNHINSHVNLRCQTILEHLIQKYNLPEDATELLDKYNSGFDEDEKFEKGRCMALTKFKVQCHRKSVRNERYCKTHINYRTNGCVDKQLGVTTTSVNGFMNADTKVDSSNDEFIVAWIDEELGSNYLVDSHNNIYANTKNNYTLVGKKEEISL